MSRRRDDEPKNLTDEEIKEEATVMFASDHEPAKVEVSLWRSGEVTTLRLIRPGAPTGVVRLSSAECRTLAMMVQTVLGEDGEALEELGPAETEAIKKRAAEVRQKLADKRAAKLEGRPRKPGRPK